MSRPKAKSAAKTAAPKQATKKTAPKGAAATGGKKVRPAPAPTAGSPMTPPKSGVKVRMYRTGLGDCFLLAFPKGKGGAFYMLVDCGTYAGTPEPDNRTRLRAVAGDILDATAGALDLLVITHEHWDHVSAFHGMHARDIFDRIDAKGLWMAWTEDVERVKLARDLHEGRKAAREALSDAQARRTMGAAPTANSRLVDVVLEFFGGPADAPLLGAKKSVRTEEAMNWLRTEYGRKGGRDKVRYLTPPDGPGSPIELDGVAGARVYVLGPPQDRDLIKTHYDPWLDGQVFPKVQGLAAAEVSFFAACRAAGRGDDETALILSRPFDERYRIDAPQVRRRIESGAALDDANDPDGSTRFVRDVYLDSDPWRQIEDDWLEAAGEFALQLDNATNNTSLAFALEIGPPGQGKVLLFPGDAQVGNWLSWFGPVQSKDGRTLGQSMAWKVGGRDITAEDLLRRTVVYKVGHHGSHNATLQMALKLMGPPSGSSELVALLPVHERVARRGAGYGEMPLRSIYEELLTRTGGRILRNDVGYVPEPEDLASSGATLGDYPGRPPIPEDRSFATEHPLYFEFTVEPPKG